MNKMTALIAAGLTVATAAAVGTPALAKDKPPVFVEAKNVKDAKVVTLDPTKAYVFVRTTNAMPLNFTRIPTAEDQAAYEKLKAAAFEDARKDYAKKLKRYESDLAASKKNKQLKAPKKPQEPTEENFQFAPFGQLANFTVGAFNRFSNKDGSTYLHAVTPGTYRIFGQTDPMFGGGVCYCMGSVTFEVVAGKITDLGSVAADPDNMPTAEKGDSAAPSISAYALKWTPADAATPIDPRIAAFPRVPATFRAAGKMPNYRGIAISRIPAIAGVIAYERDRIIDLKAQSPSQP
jgi:hypothetical protein